MSDPSISRFRRTCERLVTMFFIVGVAAVSFRRAANSSYDFKHFYIDARYVWEHGALNTEYEKALTPDGPQLLFYLPAVPVLLAPLTAFGPTSAAVAWSLLQAASAGASIFLLRRLTGLVGVGGVAFLAALPAVYEAAHFNQLSLPVLALLLGGLCFVERGNRAAGGALFGVAALFKLLPGIMLVWLALKRQWTAFASAVGVILLLALVPSIAAFGPGRAIDYHTAWVDRNVLGKPAPGMISIDGGADADSAARGHFLDYRNQSISAVAARLFVPDSRFRAPWQPLELSESVCRVVSTTVLGAAGALLLLAARRRWNDLDARSRFAEFAAFMVGMQALSPLMRQYYLVWTIPALAVVIAALERRENDAIKPSIVVMASWFAGLAAWLSPLARSYGANLLALFLIGVASLRYAAVARRRVANLASPAPPGDITPS